MDCYPAAAQRVRESADKICGGRVITQLAGGYDIPVAARAFYLVTGVMLDAPTLDITEPHGEIEDRTEADVTARGDAVITVVKQKHTSLMT
jgi:acetoin utilization deacetylase AcuC-like enzyme